MKPKILIVVRGGVAVPVCATGEVEVHIVDLDNMATEECEGDEGHHQFDHIDVLDDQGFSATIQDLKTK